MVRGYHAYKDIWTAIVRKEFQCRREGRNQFDAFAVTVMRGGTVIGYVPRKISSVCSLLLSRGGSIIDFVIFNLWFELSLPAV